MRRTACTERRFYSNKLVCWSILCPGILHTVLASGMDGPGFVLDLSVRLTTLNHACVSVS
jgi:hypothetical protein